MIKLLSSARETVVETLGLLSALAISLMAIYVSANVISRKLGWGELWAVIEVSEFLMIASVFLAMAHAERTDTHVRLTLVSSRLKPRGSKSVRAVGLFAALIIVSFFAYYSGETMMQSIEIGETRMGLAHFPVWPARVAIFVGFLFTALVLLAKLVATLRSVGSETPQATVRTIRY